MLKLEGGFSLAQSVQSWAEEGWSSTPSSKDILHNQIYRSEETMLPVCLGNSGCRAGQKISVFEPDSTSMILIENTNRLVLFSRIRAHCAVHSLFSSPIIYSWNVGKSDEICRVTCFHISSIHFSATAALFSLRAAPSLKYDPRIGTEWGW